MATMDEPAGTARRAEPAGGAGGRGGEGAAPFFPAAERGAAVPPGGDGGPAAARLAGRVPPAPGRHGSGRQPAQGGEGRRRALLSVADKRGIADLGRALHRLGWELVSTGRTAAALREAGVPVIPVQEVTGFPELLGGRVKTLHPAIHAGILARRHVPGDLAALAGLGIVPIDLVVVNLYPFAEAAAAGAAGPDLLEEIDIGGPALIRAAAKNWPGVTVVVDPEDYARVIAALEATGEVPARLRRELAAKAFAHTAYYDAVIALTLGAGAAGAGPAAGQPGAGRDTAGVQAFWPDRLVLPLRREAVLRYGENPHQGAAVYRVAFPGAAAASGPGAPPQAAEAAPPGAGQGQHPADPSGPGPESPGRHRETAPGQPPGSAAGARLEPPVIGGFRQLAGKELSYNNLVDAGAAWRAVLEFASPAAVAVKHATPCGIGCAATLADAFRLARDADPESIFGGIVALNRPLDGDTAALLAEIFLEVVIAPGVTEEAREILARRKNLRLLVPAPARAAGPAGGAQESHRAITAVGLPLEWRGWGDVWLVQQADPPALPAGRREWRVATRRVPAPAEWEALEFAWRAVKHCRSNAIVVAAPQPGGGWRTLGIGAGQTSRVRAVVQALAMAGEAAAGAVLASDGFFPFADSVERAAEAGIAAIVQPGGSVRDPEVLAAADRAGIAMVLTGRRHFRH